MTFADQPVGEFLDKLASGRATLSGGAVATVGALLAAAALHASVSTVRANLDILNDESAAVAMKQRADEVEAAGEAALDEAVVNAEQ